MGVRKCIVFGCKAVYKSAATIIKNGEKENGHFFLVPKAQVEEWQRAILRTDIVVKPGQAVCQKHFRKKDILWRKELRGPDGQILGVSADFRVPKLRKGALPCRFLGISSARRTEVSSDSEAEESSLKGEVVKTSESNKKITNIAKVVKSDNGANIKNVAKIGDVAKIHKINTIQTHDHNYYNGEKDTVQNLYSEIANEKLILKSYPHQMEVKNENSEPVQIEEKPVFEIIYLNEKSVALPLGWCRGNMRFDGKRVVHFCQFIPKMENGIIQPACTKQVLVDENLEVSILLMRQKIDKEKSDLRVKHLTCIEDLEHLLQWVNGWKLCPGISMNKDEVVRTPAVHQDKEGTWRNVQCLLYIPGSSRNVSCDKCKLSKKVLARKLIRMKGGADLQRLRVTLSLPQQKRLEEMRKELRCLRRGRDRALARIQILKDQRLLDTQKFTAKQKDLRQLILESELEGNQKLVMLEIMSTSNQTDTRARRYSRVWMSLCLTLHRRSPVTYRFLRANNILPLPTPRTVLRFAQHNPPVTNIVPALSDKIDTVEETIEDVILESEELFAEDQIPTALNETEVS